MLLSVSGCVASHDDVANSRTQPLMSISGSTQLVGHRVRRSTIYVSTDPAQAFFGEHAEEAAMPHDVSK